MYDTEKAIPVYEGPVIIGYIFPVNDEYWLPLDLKGAPCGPPSYKKDAEYIVQRPIELTTEND